MITFFTTTEKFNFQFLNSLESWLKLSSVSEIVVYTSLTEGLEDYPSDKFDEYGYCSQKCEEGHWDFKQFCEDEEE